MSNTEFCKKNQNNAIGSICKKVPTTMSWNSFGKALSMAPEVIKGMVEMIFTPEGLEVLAAFEMSTYVWKKVVVNLLVKKVIRGTLVKLAGTEAEAAIGTKVMALLAEEAVAAIDIFLIPVMLAIDTFMILSMLIDMWDPCALNKQIDGTSLEMLTDNYNIAFRTAIMSNIGSTIDSDGNKIFIKDWPIEFNGNSFLSKLALNTDDGQCEYYSQLNGLFTSSYLLSLKTNSQGLPINWKDPEAIQAITQTVPHGDEINKMIKRGFWDKYNSTPSIFVNNNTIAQNWLSKNWPIIVFIFSLIIIIVIFLIQKKGNKNLQK